VTNCVLIEIISCPAGTIIEISLDALLVDDGIVALNHVSIATGVTRAAYYGYLDFSANGASAKLQPVGVSFLL